MDHKKAETMCNVMNMERNAMERMEMQHIYWHEL